MTLLTVQESQLIARAFYSRIRHEPTIFRFYHNRNLVHAEQTMALYLAELSGGPRLYTARRGRPRMGLRHYPFPIGPRHLSAWLRIMRSSMEEALPSCDARIAPFMKRLDEEGRRMLLESQGRAVSPTDLGNSASCPFATEEPDDLLGRLHEAAWRMERAGNPTLAASLLEPHADTDADHRTAMTVAWELFLAGDRRRAADYLRGLLSLTIYARLHPMTMMSWGRMYAQVSDEPERTLWAQEVQGLWRIHGYVR